MPTPEEIARELIDQQLQACGWTIQDRQGMNLFAGRGVAVREFPVEGGFADYLLFVDRKAVGVVEAKKAGTTLSGVAEQAGMYAASLPGNIPHIGQEKLPSFINRPASRPISGTNATPSRARGGCSRSIVPRPWRNGPPIRPRYAPACRLCPRSIL